MLTHIKGRRHFTSKAPGVRQNAAFFAMQPYQGRVKESANFDATDLTTSHEAATCFELTSQAPSLGPHMAKGHCDTGEVSKKK